jgi:hypothetical protein
MLGAQNTPTPKSQLPFFVHRRRYRTGGAVICPICESPLISTCTRCVGCGAMVLSARSYRARFVGLMLCAVLVGGAMAALDWRLGL